MIVRIAILFCLVAVAHPLSAHDQDAGSPNSRELVDAAENSAWSTVHSLIESGANPDQAQLDGMTALHWAVFHGQTKTVGRLIEANANVDAETIYKVTLLSLACEVGDVSSVRLLLAAKADVESKRLGGERPLMIAARRGNHVMVRALIASNADLNARETGSQTALMWAAAHGHSNVVAELIKAGAELELETRGGFTALMFAARNGKSTVVRQMLEAGIDVNTVMKLSKDGGRKPRKGTSALMLAVESGHFELALELVKHGADPNDQRSGYAPLHAVSWVRKTKRGDDPAGDPAPRGSGLLTSTQFVRALIAAGADVNLKLKNGNSAGKAKLNHKGATPFLMASSTADLPLMKLLIELGADPTQNNADGCTPLMAAAGVGVVAVGEEPGTEDEVNAAIEYLVGLGLDPNVVDKNGETAMHGAAYRCFPEAVAALAACGADPRVWNQMNKHKWTPHRIAEGYRPGSFKPSPTTIAALDAALKVVDTSER